ncbi:MAG: hypothetical protein LBQ23_00865 [Puniceicoccales bacterium]|nr:hypothetical protein [Puniceicoccales bacterium]
MNITLTNFRLKMFKLMPKVKAGVPLTITYKNEDYVLTKVESRREKIIKQLQMLPKLNISREEVKSLTNWGRK